MHIPNKGSPCPAACDGGFLSLVTRPTGWGGGGGGGGERSLVHVHTHDSTHMTHDLAMCILTSTIKLVVLNKVFDSREAMLF